MPRVPSLVPIVVTMGRSAYPQKGGFATEKADDGTRTHDTWLGKPVLYQLSYVRRLGAIVPGQSSEASAARSRATRVLDFR